MRLSATQKDVLFVLYGMQLREMDRIVQGMQLLALLNNNRGSDIHASNFRTSCNTLVEHGLLRRYRNSALKLAFSLTETGAETGNKLYDERVAEFQD